MLGYTGKEQQVAATCGRAVSGAGVWIGGCWS